MKQRILVVVALFGIIAAMAGIAAAKPYDATLVSHVGVVAPQDIKVFPGEMFHLHFRMSTMSAATLNNPVDYNPANGSVALAPPGIGNPSDITLKVTDPLSNKTGLPSFTPCTDPYIDFGLTTDCNIDPVHPNRIEIAVGQNAPPGAGYALNFPTGSEVSGENGTASRTIHVISPNTTLTKTASPTTLSLGPGGSGMVTYTITEKNTGDVPLNTTVTDPGANASCTPSLPDTRQYNPGDSVTFTCTETFTDADNGTHTNTATAVGNPIVFNPEIGQNVTVTSINVTETASATVNVIISICPTSAAAIAPGTIAGCKFYDINKNGKRDPNEPGRANFTIRLSGIDTKPTFHLVVNTTVTDSNGFYQFTDVSPGNYIVCEIPQPNWKPTTPPCVFVPMPNPPKGFLENFGNGLTGSIMPRMG